MAGIDAESPFTFPCAFQVKAMGRNEPGFRGRVEGVVRRHLESSAVMTVRETTSRADNYLSVSCHFTATSREQLDAIYMDLSADPVVLVAL